MDQPSAEMFDAIRNVALTALHEIEALPSAERSKFGTVNWADLGVGDVVHCRDRDGWTWFYVEVGAEVGEASPGCALEWFVSKRLCAAFPGTVMEIRARR